MGIGAFSHAASDVHRRLSDFIHQVVVHRRDEAVGGWRNWIPEDFLVHRYKWLRPDLVPPATFLQCKPHLTPDGSGVILFIQLWFTVGMRLPGCGVIGYGRIHWFILTSGSGLI